MENSSQDLGPRDSVHVHIPGLMETVLASVQTAVSTAVCEFRGFPRMLSANTDLALLRVPAPPLQLSRASVIFFPGHFPSPAYVPNNQSLRVQFPPAHSHLVPISHGTLSCSTVTVSSVMDPCTHQDHLDSQFQVTLCVGGKGSEGKASLQITIWKKV
jgi:hypothetical protein